MQANSPFFLIILFLFIACNNPPKVPQRDIDNRDLDSNRLLEEIKTIESCQETNAVVSVKLKDYLNLEHELEVSKMSDTLGFRAFNDDQVKEEFISLPAIAYELIRVKAKRAMKVQGQKFYPDFRIRSFCIIDSEEGHQIREKAINKIINSRDFGNEKLYDYLIRKQNWYLYVSTNVKLYEDYIFGLRSALNNTLIN